MQIGLGLFHLVLGRQMMVLESAGSSSYPGLHLNVTVAKALKLPPSLSPFSGMLGMVQDLAVIKKEWTSNVEYVNIIYIYLCIYIFSKPNQTERGSEKRKLTAPSKRIGFCGWVHAIVKLATPKLDQFWPREFSTCY